MKAPGAPLIIEHLSKRYGDVAVVSDLNLTLQRGECFGLLGPNGAGKTTTMRLVLGHTAPDGGHISLLGEPIPARAREARMRVGVVPQQDSLDPDFTVAENLRVFGRYFGIPESVLTARLPELLEFAALTGRADAKIATLSGGMKRRLTLARALIHKPEFLLLDEPTTGLDPQARRLIWERLKTLSRAGTTLLLTTHFMEEAERLCDRLAILDHGRVIAQGSPSALIAEHIGTQVVEISGLTAPTANMDDAICAADWVRSQQAMDDMAGVRVEFSGETAFCYTQAPELVLARIAQAPGLRSLHRPANLEDVFLKLTGHDLRD